MLLDPLHGDLLALEKMLQSTRRPSKRRPKPEHDTGPEAAAKYMLRRSMRSGKASTLRKVMRAENIAAGRRILKNKATGDDR